MAIPMRSTDFRAIVEPILKEEFDGVYEQRVDEWRGPFREQQGIPRNYHEEPVLYGFSAAPELPDGSRSRDSCLDHRVRRPGLSASCIGVRPPCAPSGSLGQPLLVSSSPVDRLDLA